MLIDINVSYGNWPFQHWESLPLQDLADHLQREGIKKAYVSHLGGVFNPDADPFNRELLAEAKQLPIVTPVPVVNPLWPAWKGQLSAYGQVEGVKIYPAYHGYSLTSPVMDPLMAYVIQHDIQLLIQMRVEDERMQHHALQVAGVPVDEVIQLHRRYPEMAFICLNTYLPEAERLGRETTSVGVDTSFCEWLFTMERLTVAMPAERIFFGSHTPFLYTKAGIMKVTHSRLSDTEKKRWTG